MPASRSTPVAPGTKRARPAAGGFSCITKLDTDNIDFPGLIASIKKSSARLRPAERAAGHWRFAAGVASTLQVPDDTDGAVIDPSEINESLIESIIEVDEAVMETYFEGEMPVGRRLAELMVQAIAPAR